MSSNDMLACQMSSKKKMLQVYKKGQNGLESKRKHH